MDGHRHQTIKMSQIKVKISKPPSDLTKLVWVVSSAITFLETASIFYINQSYPPWLSLSSLNVCLMTIAIYLLRIWQRHVRG